jgi:hypothetical protein
MIKSNQINGCFRGVLNTLLSCSLIFANIWHTPKAFAKSSSSSQINSDIVIKNALQKLKTTHRFLDFAAEISTNDTDKNYFLEIKKQSPNQKLPMISIDGQYIQIAGLKDKIEVVKSDGNDSQSFTLKYRGKNFTYDSSKNFAENNEKLIEVFFPENVSSANESPSFEFSLFRKAYAQNYKSNRRMLEREYLDTGDAGAEKLKNIQSGLLTGLVGVTMMGTGGFVAYSALGVSPLISAGGFVVFLAGLAVLSSSTADASELPTTREISCNEPKGPMTTYFTTKDGRKGESYVYFKDGRPTKYTINVGGKPVLSYFLDGDPSGKNWRITGAADGTKIDPDSIADKTFLMAYSQFWQSCLGSKKVIGAVNKVLADNNTSAPTNTSGTKAPAKKAR